MKDLSTKVNGCGTICYLYELLRRKLKETVLTRITLKLDLICAACFLTPDIKQNSKDFIYHSNVTILIAMTQLFQKIEVAIWGVEKTKVKAICFNPSGHFVFIKGMRQIKVQ